MDLFLESLSKAGIGKAVAMGRFAPGGPPTQRSRIPNEDVAALVAAYPDHFFGFGSVDVRDPAGARQEIDRIVDLGLRGVAFENPRSDPALYDDDPSLLALYERCCERGLVAAITASAMTGDDISYSNPVHIQRVGLAFPELPIVVPHGFWPWVTQATAVLFQSLSFKLSQVYLMPDFYLHQDNVPGSQGYLDAARWGLADRILFGSSYPAMEPAAAIEHFRAISFDDHPEIPEKILSTNAQRLLASVLPR
jgi:predicted TIM-barrel fold metal-dependent hydrolase